MKGSTEVSVIIVNYKSEEFLYACIDSIYTSSLIKPEIIVVDNDEGTNIKSNLKKKFPQVVYVKNKENTGYGSGNNLGSKYATGKYLFFLNPDTLLEKNCLDKLHSFMEKNKNIGGVSPLILDRNEKPYVHQGAKPLNFFNGLLTFSFLSKLTHYSYFFHWNKKSKIEVGVLPGTSFFTSKEIFQTVGKFDEKFFLYFEETDLSKRIKEQGYLLFMISDAKLIHYWGESTKLSSEDMKAIFNQSRFYYFRKHYGLLSAIIIDMLSRINKYTIVILSILVISGVLRFYGLQKYMMFIGDFGWFFLSARDLVLGHEFPLVGITASRTWLHQGPLWTYMLAVFLKIFQFNPLAGAYLGALLSIITTMLMYTLTKTIFSRNVGLIAALLFAVSPLITVHARMPYHTSPIPLFTILFIFSLYKWIHGKTFFFPFVVISLSLLYNLELATFVFAFIFFLYYFIGFIKKKSYVRLIQKFQYFYAFLGSVIVMLPIIFYDINNGFPQTLKFIAWFPYRIFKVMTGSNVTSFSSLNETVAFLITQTSRIVFPYNTILAIGIWILCFIIITYFFAKNKWNIFSQYGVLLMCTVIPLLAYIINQTPSDAYFPMLFPQFVIVLAIGISILMKHRIIKLPLIVVLFTLTLLNVFYLFNSQFMMGRNGVYGHFFSDRLLASKRIVEIANNKKYNLIGEGPGSNFKSFTDNYRYLTWYLGNEASVSKENFKIHLYELPNGIRVLEK